MAEKYVNIQKWPINQQIHTNNRKMREIKSTCTSDHRIS